jgi:uncharacterized membrane protein
MKRILRYLGRYFLQGLLYIVPISVTVYILMEGFIFLDSLIPLDIPGMGILSVLITITLIGFVGSFIIALPITTFLENYIKKAPLVKIIYTSVKDLISAFVGQKKSFNKPVLMKMYENSELQRIGFVTDEHPEAISLGKDLITVYVPHSYAVSGQLFVVPRHYVTPLDAQSAEVMKYIISGGVTEVTEQGVD